MPARLPPHRLKHPCLPNDAGVSLVEILVAVMIIGIVSTAVVFSLQPGGGALREEAERLNARLVFASQEAVAIGQPVGMVLEDFGSGYSFERYVDQRWWPLGDNPAFARHSLDEGIRLYVLDAPLNRADDDVPSRVPLFWFDPAGLTEPFALRLEDAETTLELRWTGSATTGWEEVSG